MPKCPTKGCGKDIDQLEAMKLTTRWFSLDETGNPVYEESHNFDTEVEFACSHCGITLFYSEEEAAAFLKGEEDVP